LYATQKGQYSAVTGVTPVNQDRRPYRISVPHRDAGRQGGSGERAAQRVGPGRTGLLRHCHSR
jgi:hypothetical protein